MARVIVRSAECGDFKSCPTIERVEGGFDLVGYRRDDPSLSPDEARIHWPDSAQMLPEVTDLHVRPTDLDDYFEQRRRTPGDLLRVQTLDRYNVASDEGKYECYLNGEPKPMTPFLEGWYQELRDDAAVGRVWRNVHVVKLPLTDYLRYQFEWGYAYNVRAGQDVRVVDTQTHPEAELFFDPGDFYVFEHNEILHMRYDKEGHFLGGVGAGASSTRGYVALAELAWRLATPFDEWWAAHPEFHRDRL
ncbi:DUF6879 family protein [Pseudonocardia acaciae]|uniref:DUF6879 family protein n=1 Tax=Pseudonocardia acaciae TaxID=551276 RepID=UPI0012ED2C87|nr:DUF6879 family protein [Pseudonocardia acaciae]